MNSNEFEIVVDAEGGRIVFALSDEEASVRVTVSRAGLSAASDVPFQAGNVVEFSNFFNDLGQHAAGWSDSRSVTSWRGDELTIECCFNNSYTNRKPEVDCTFVLASDFQDPWWKVELNFILLPEALQELGVRAAAFFDALKKHLDTEVV